MNFRPPQPRETVPDSPEKLFYSLPRSSKSAPSLWLHQGDVLRTYYEKHRNARDLAVELPTGTGKTLPGLLIVDWNRRFRDGARTVFACPTTQLVRQVLEVARNHSIPAVDLSGSWRDWPREDRLKFESGAAIAVATYSGIFNSNPQLREVDTVLFDDAHAGEQYVGAAYSVEITRDEPSGLYGVLLEALEGELPPGQARRLQQNSPDIATKRSVNLVLPGRSAGLLERVDELIHEYVADTSLKYPYSLIRSHLQACMIYVKWDQILVRPLVAPTFENPVFVGARQRIYLSATLGEAGELERSFGRERIKRLPLPESATNARSGRRFFVFPGLVQTGDRDLLTKELVKRAGKSIVLTPSNFGVKLAEQKLVPDGWNVFKKNDVAKTMQPFAQAGDAVCILANRYDGIDLPGDACHSVLLYGHPIATNLQEEYLSSRAMAAASLGERVRSRVVQGTGRCTRNPSDWALVIVCDDDMTRYLARPAVQKSMEVDLQAEIAFGLGSAEISETELLQNVDMFLAQGDDWADLAEPVLAEYREVAARTPTSASAALAGSASHEVKACALAWQGEWKEAAAEANLAAESLAGNHEVEGYRAFWLLLAAFYLNRYAAEAGDDTQFAISDAIANQAVAAAQPATWVRELLPLPGRTDVQRPEWDVEAVNTLAARIAGLNMSKHERQAALMTAGLEQTQASLYEPALSHLGELLGAEAYKPAGDGQCDSAWCWGDAMWLTVEAKSDEDPNGVIPLQDVRQTIPHVSLLASQRGAAAPEQVASVIVSPRTSFAPEAVTAATSGLFHVGPDALVELARATVDLWDSLVLIRHSKDEEANRAAISDLLAHHRLFPSDVFERLTSSPIGDR